jgi:DNA-directed RNA polymerase specialized sigma24 family protein
MASVMLRRFPGVARWEETGDILQGATMRLLRSLETLSPNSVAEFLGLAALQMRRELLDLARRHEGEKGRSAALAHPHPHPDSHDPAGELPPPPTTRPTWNRGPRFIKPWRTCPPRNARW